MERRVFVQRSMGPRRIIIGSIHASLNGRNINVKRGRKVVTKTPRGIIGAENVTALKHAGFVVVRLSALSKLRTNVKSVLDILSGKAPRNDRV
jgi:hypothetical protein